MKKYVVVISLLFGSIACTNNKTEQESSATTDSTSQVGHSADNNPAAGENHMKSMHDAMNNMMDQMHTMKPSGDPDYDFAMMMKHHHQGAIEMAKSEIAAGTDSKLKQKAQKMIDVQQSEITVFDKILKVTPPAGNSDFGQKAIGMMTPMSEIKMESGSLDAMFASMMISHHEDAIKMGQEYLKVGRNEEIKKVAQNIVLSQQKEIEELQDWIKNN